MTVSTALVSPCYHPYRREKTRRLEAIACAVRPARILVAIRHRADSGPDSAYSSPVRRGGIIFRGAFARPNAFCEEEATAKKPAKKPAVKPAPKKKLAKKAATAAKRPPKPKQNNWLTPYLTVADAKASIEFYGRAFGFQPGLQIPGPGGAPMHAEMTYKGTTVIMFAPEGAMGSPMKTPSHAGVPGAVGLYVYCDDVDALAQRAKAAGATTLSEPETMFWGDRMARFEDPDGYSWTFATNVADFDASKMPK